MLCGTTSTPPQQLRQMHAKGARSVHVYRSVELARTDPHPATVHIIKIFLLFIYTRCPLPVGSPRIYTADAQLSACEVIISEPSEEAWQAPAFDEYVVRANDGGTRHGERGLEGGTFAPACLRLPPHRFHTYTGKSSILPLIPPKNNA